ncbi:response regulator transcription factor [Tepidibacter formicigenes]|jgi:DNA-binding response OmpR family regulator|uniref:Stage 0 sporulation protein A homolog n=1 Tax=Tepidibacter formicigenes DSM 15518 TaxID=1123349 RepID=A0A1M6LYV3_9FIRM|nr:response regulator transcription factor [Tepidibacter formicigenes]SHJ76384.1 DNA-binding response regulator, OmpR family, contains REC and winged-helix (wHTH) domain [Tepidibacter formicigenes DSM 15518]
MVKILIIDDQPLLIKQIKYAFEDEYYKINRVYDGDEGLKKIENKSYDIIILESELNKRDGFQICKEIREYSSVPIIMITPMGEDLKKIMALEFGADDCISKPLNVLELKARIKAILRRTKKVEEVNLSPEFQIGEFKINTLGRKISYKDEDINLTGKEFDLFLFLITNPNKVFNRQELLEKIWGYEYYGDLRTVDVHIRRLREKIEKNSSSPRHILTKWGMGYYFKEN